MRKEKGRTDLADGKRTNGGGTGDIAWDGKRRTCPGNGGGNGGRVDLQADPSGGRFATEHSGQAGRKKQTGRTSSEPDDAVSDFRRTGQGGTTVDLSEVFSGKDTGSSGGDSRDFTGSGVENGKENTGADEKADVSRL